MRKYKFSKNIFFDLETKYFFSFGDFFLSKELELTWGVLLDEFKEEWDDLFIGFDYEDEQEDEDIILYELPFSSEDSVAQQPVTFSLDSVVLDFEYEEEESLNENSTVIPDDFEFDEFFFDYFYLFMILSFFFFPFFLLELSFFSLYIFYINSYSLVNAEEEEEEDEDPFDFLDSEADISHYDFAEFHFEEYLSFEEMFFLSGFWRNKPYPKHLILLKKKK